MRYFLSIFLSCIFLSSSLFAQEGTIDERNLNFYDIQEEFEKQWEGKNIGHDTPKEERGGWKQFKRWEWFWEQRTAPTGEFPDPMHLYKEMKRWKRNYGNEEKLQSNGTWSSVGPGQSSGGYNGLGRLNFVKEDPDYDGNTNRTIYVGAATGGLWRTTDDGSNWEVLTDDQTVLAISDIAIDPGDTDILYIATGDGDGLNSGSGIQSYGVGVLKSTDGGATWSTTGLNFSRSSARTVNHLLMDPTDSDIIYAGCSNGLYKTTDGGVNWSTQISNTRIWDIEFKPGSTSALYASGDSRIYRTTDGGANWSQTTNGLPTSGIRRIDIAVTADDGSYVYALISESSPYGFEGLYRSTDSGQNWSTMSTTPNLLGWTSDGSDNGGQGWYDLCIAANPTDKNEIYVGGVNVHKSTDGGASWTCVAMWTGHSAYNKNGAPVVHADHHDLIFANGSQRLYSGNDGGIYRTTNGGSSWSWMGNGLVITQNYRLGVSQSATATIITGTQDNGTKLVNSSNWSDVIGGDGMECLINPDNGNEMFGSLYYGEIRRSTNGGLSFSGIGKPTGENGNWVTPFLLDPSNSDHLYVGFTEVYRTTNDGGNWTKLSNFSGSTRLDVLTIAPSDNQYIYAGWGSTLQVTTDGGANWSEISDPSGFSITYVTVHPADPETIWITYSGYTSNTKVYKSTDAGANWTNLSGNLPNVPVNCVIYQEDYNNRIYVGTDLGVYYLDDNDTDWQEFNNGLPNVVVNEIEIHASQEKLYAASWGRGLWSIDIPTEQLAAPVLNNPSDGATGVALDSDLAWNSVQDATSYSVQVDDDSQFGSPIINESGVNGTTFDLSNSNLSDNTQYFWRVNATDGQETSDWSTVWDFTTEDIIDAPVLDSPADNATEVALDADLSWNSVLGATSYGVQLDDDSQFGSPLVDQSGILSMNFDLANSGLQNSTEYFWRVNATDGSETSDWSEVNSFTTVAETLLPPLPYFPEDGQLNVFNTDFLEWDPVDGKDSYRLQIAYDQNFNTMAKDQAGITDEFYDLSNITLGSNLTYYWRVLTEKDGNESAWSDVFSFNSYPISQYCAAKANTCDEFISRVQMNNIDNQSGCAWGYTDFTNKIINMNREITKTLTVTNGSPYASDNCGVWIDWNQDGDFDDAGETISMTGSPGQGPYTADITTPADAELGNTRMRVRIVFNSQPDPCFAASVGEVEDYTIKVNKGPSDPPSFDSPVNDAEFVSQNPRFEWEDLSQAESYRLQIATDKFFNNIEFNQASISNNYYKLPNNTLDPNTTYYWRLAATVDGLEGNFTDNPWKFKTGSETDDEKTTVSFVYANITQCNSTWTENGVGVKVTQTTADDCDNGGNCDFTEDLSDEFWLNGARLELDISNLNLEIETVTFEIYDNCGAGCTQAWMYAGANEIDMVSNDATKASTLTLSNPNEETITKVVISSCQAGIFECAFNHPKDYLDVPDEWDFTDNTGSKARVTVPANINPRVAGRDFVEGDAVGVFFDDNGNSKCAGYGVWNGSTMLIDVWGDNPQTQEKDGFDNNETYAINIWDGQAGIEYEATFTISFGPDNFQNNANTILSMLKDGTDQQTVSVGTGWSIISSFIDPQTPDMIDMFSEIKDDIVIVKNGAGATYIPQFGLNNIGDWNVEHGYQVYNSSQNTLDLIIEGDILDPTSQDVNVGKGWNIVSYIRNSNKDAVDAFASITDDGNLVIAKNSSGAAYIPMFGLNNIGDLVTGQGYQLYVTSADVIKYPANGGSRAITAGNQVPVNKFIRPEFEKTGNNATIIVKADLPDNAEIGAIDSEGKIYGAGVVRNGVAAVSTWGDNNQTDAVDGAVEDMEIELIAYIPSSGQRASLKPLNLKDMTNGNSVDKLSYGKDNVIVADVKVVLENTEIMISNTPNPFTATTEINYTLPAEGSVNLELYNLRGKKIMTLFEGRGSKGINSVMLDGSALASGDYTVVVTFGDFRAAHKIAIAK